MKRNILAAILVVTYGALALADPAKIYTVQGSPNTVQFGNTGDLCTSKTGGAVFVKTGGYSATGWIQITGTSGQAITVLSGTSNNGAPVAGTLLATSTSVKLYLTATTGKILVTGTTTAADF